MKQRYSSLDVKVIANELSQTLPSLRISNIYDLSSRIFLFKFAKPGTKAQLLVDSGFRAHLTSFQRTANPTPSAFTSRLRKYLKTRRVTGVSQLGTDRVIEIKFSDGQYKLFLEFFAAGNIVLTDAELNVLALLRQVSEGDENVDVKLGGKYVLDVKQNYHGIPAVTQERVRDVLQKQVDRMKEAQAIGGKKAKRNKGGNDLGKALSSGFSEFPNHLMEHALIEVGLDETVKPADVLEKEELMNQVMLALKKAETILNGLGSEATAKGYIVAKEKVPSKEGDTSQTGIPPRDALLYDDFHPFRPSQFSSIPGTHILEFEGFNKTVDEFYSSIESQKLESRLTEREETAKRKLESAKSEHEKRLGALQQVQEMHVRKAQAIEANTHRVEEAAAAVNGLISQGMDWVDIGKLIENEQGRGNVVAQLIKLPLKLHENTVTLLLDEPGADAESESDEDDQTDTESESDEEDTAKSRSKPATTDKRLSIDIDLGITPWANARQYYDQKRTAAVKQQKTAQASDRALKAIEHKTEADLKKGLKQEKTALRPSRKQFWFEKFLWFISSDGYLVIGGKDAQQNEMLYRRYLKKGDIYVHADLAGASSVIIKNNPETPDAPIPPSTLSQAGALTVCTSSAWDSKAIMAAWWVAPDQVSKTAETGEYIKTGGFMIRGKKNFLPPTQLVLGFSSMWLISEESKANRGKNRVPQTESTLDGETEALIEDAKDLSLDDDDDDGNMGDPANNDSAIVDVEDVAEDAEKEIQEDEEAADASDDDDVASTVASEVEVPRSNPLQMNNVSAKQASADDDQSDIESDAEAQTHDDQESDDEDKSEEDNEPDTVQPSSKTAPQKSQQAQPQSKQSKPKRGANTKAKRAAAKKYALQDEEERELAMSLLGSSKGAEKKAAAEEARLAREAKSAADKERRRQQHEKAAMAERAKQERLAKAEQNGETAVEEYEMDDEQIELERKEHINIDLLVPYPQPGDELIAAVPVVAPWTALARNKYKVKLQPGSTKKGKAVKEIVGNWTNLGTKGPRVVDETNQDKEKVWAREIECFKAWRVEEVFGTVPVRGVRLMQSGGIMGAAGDKSGKGKGTARGGKGGKKGGR